MFEWDEQKNQANIKKHGIAFSAATALWDDEDGIELPLPYTDELRIIRIAAINSVVWSAIFTIRHNNIRIISVRIARVNERILYEKEKN